MKRLITMMLALIMAVSCLMVPASASDTESAQAGDISTIAPRQILTYSKVHRAYVGANAVDITIKFTARDDIANDSGYYITGILNSSIKNVSGWYSVGAVSINRSGITYSNNFQYASVPVTYQASGGSGFHTYTTTVSINTYVDC